MSTGGITIRWDANERTFASGDLRIGRDPTCDVVVNNENVSRVHAELRSTGDGWTLTDNGSSQGTFVNGDRVQSATISGTTTVVLGRPDLGTRIELVVEAAKVVPDDERTLAHAGATAMPPSAPERPGGALREKPEAAGTVVVGEEINIECAGRNYMFQPGRERVIGRDDDCDIVSANPTVSRRHAVLRHSTRGWRLDDLGSSGGTFVDGKRMQTVALHGATPVMLGDPDSGERVVLVTSGTRELSPVQRLERAARGGRGVLVVAIIAIVAVIAAGIAVFAASSGSSGVSNDKLARATVMVNVTGPDESAQGSGTVIDAAHGLILTNAHVAAPNAPGMGAYNATTNVGQARTSITISVSPGNGRAAQPAFTAEPVNADGYADLAIVRVTKTIAGTLVTPTDLKQLQQITLGDSDSMKVGSTIKLVGYPADSQSAAPTIKPGSITALTESDRMHSNRAWFNIDTQIGAGNSGGGVIDSDGHLVGIPSRAFTTGDSIESVDRSDLVRPVNFAKPMLAAALAGKSYVSPFVTLLT
ncbi:MAG TPA: FHA domain-containing protein, partial [Acidimicrobiia bacterium]|nr:FHA domain-containing protein [Acidimicrobiia bacterium]